MTLYEMPAQRPYQKPFRIGAGVAIVLLLVILYLALNTPEWMSDLQRKLLVGAAGVIVVGGVVGGYFISFKEASWKNKRGCGVELADGNIIQRRPGAPLVEIPVNQIASLRQLPGGWLVVRASEPERLIAIPAEVPGFEDLKREVSAHCPVTSVKPSAWLYLAPALLILAVGFLFFSHNHTIALTAGCAILLMEIFGIASLLRMIKSNPKAKLVSVLYILIFVASCWVVFGRVTSRF